MSVVAPLTALQQRSLHCSSTTGRHSPSNTQTLDAEGVHLFCLAPRHACTCCRRWRCVLLQIGLFAIPFVTIVGWVLGHPFSLGFDPFAGRQASRSTTVHPVASPDRLARTASAKHLRLQLSPQTAAAVTLSLCAAGSTLLQDCEDLCVVLCLPVAALVLLLSVMHAAHMINDAESHWLEGMQLIVTYFM